MISLLDSVVLITGASRGIGAATARLCAQAGANIVINFVEQEERAQLVAEDVRAFGRRALLYRGNVADTRVAGELFDRACKSFGRVDVVVNNAGIWTFTEIGSAREDVWSTTIDVNLKGTFNVCNAAVPVMKQRGGGRIINIASTAGQRGEAFHSHYAASKGGMLALTKSLAVELAPHHILVNAVAPGWVDTELNEGVFGDAGFRQQVINAIPLKRIAAPEDVAGSVLFLASQFANHITGATINVNGGAVLN